MPSCEYRAAGAGAATPSEADGKIRRDLNLNAWQIISWVGKLA